MAEEEAASAVSALSLDAVTAAGVAEQIRQGDASTSFAVFALEDEAAAVTLVEHGAGDIGSVAPRLPQGNVRFVYGRVVLDETKGGLDHVAAAGLGRRKLVLLTWVGEDTPPRERGAVSALRAALKNKIPELVVHCELSATTAADAEQAGIVEKVKKKWCLRLGRVRRRPDDGGDERGRRLDRGDGGCAAKGRAQARAKSAQRA